MGSKFDQALKWIRGRSKGNEVPEFEVEFEHFLFIYDEFKRDKLTERGIKFWQKLFDDMGTIIKMMRSFFNIENQNLIGEEKFKILTSSLHSIARLMIRFEREKQFEYAIIQSDNLFCLTQKLRLLLEGTDTDDSLFSRGLYFAVEKDEEKLLTALASRTVRWSDSPRFYGAGRRGYQEFIRDKFYDSMEKMLEDIKWNEFIDPQKN